MNGSRTDHLKLLSLGCLIEFFTRLHIISNPHVVVYDFWTVLLAYNTTNHAWVQKEFLCDYSINLT